ncbi:MAG: MarR family transcriptional regulator [Pseudomonadota bacterium]
MNAVTDRLPSDDELERLRRINFGRLLDVVHVGFDRLALELLRAAGYPAIRAAHTHVLRTMRAEGSTLTDMADRAGISKQAMSKLVTEFEGMGFVEWREGRPRKVHTTSAGITLLKHGVVALERAEDAYFGDLSETEREALRTLLLKIADGEDRGRDPDWRRRRA